MQEMRYRAWDYVEKIMRYSSGGKSIGDNIDGFTFNADGSVSVFYQNAGGDPVWFENFDAYDKPLPVMRYSGLKDKDGIDIYESDIIELWDILIVKFGEYDNGYTSEDNESGIGWYFQELDGSGIGGMQFCSQSEMKVIGNVHDNPELLKEVD